MINRIFLCLTALLLTLSLCACAAETPPTTPSAAPSATTPSKPTESTNSPSVLTAEVGDNRLRIEWYKAEGYRASCGKDAMTLPMQDGGDAPVSLAFKTDGELTYPAAQRSLRLSRFAEESNAYLVQLTVGFFPKDVHSRIRKDASWQPIGDLTSAVGTTYSAYTVGDAYYLVAAPEGSALCVVLHTARDNPAIDMLTFSRY